MAVRGARADSFRVVVLSRDPALSSRLTAICAPGIEVARVASGYEAGAEVLAAPVAAIVIDFRALGSAHGRLLHVARRMDVEMLGVGSLPTGMTTEDLSGVRLIAAAELPGALDELAAAATKADEPAETPGAEQAPPPEAAPPAPPVPQPPRIKPTRPRKAGKRAAKPADRRAARARTPTRQAAAAESPGERPAEQAADSPAPAPPPEAQPPQAAPQAPGNLLTPEEIAALLENEP